MESDGEDQVDQVTGVSKRSHHNALERKRRDHIKESFNGLRDSVPALQGEKASRAQILNKATEYIEQMTRLNSTDKQDIDELRRQNNLLELRIRTLERAKKEGILSTSPNENNLDEKLEMDDGSP
ncbi:protein max-like [Clavelina lepadiformis]|uniref:Protein max n=1 Tax=Clavelina lepadiformis TaxID=159417 RepID=A0ABP0GPN2_CLALP